MKALSATTALASGGGPDDPAVVVCHPGFERACVRLAGELPLSKNRTHEPILSIMLRYGQGKCSYEEAMLEFYFGNLSIARLNALASAYWDETGWAAVVSAQAAAIRQALLPALSRKIRSPQVYVFLQAVEFQLKAPGANRSVVLAAAVGMGADGMREVLEVDAASPGEDFWDDLLRSLKRRGLHGAALFVGENDTGAHEAVRRHFPGVLYQGCLNQLESEVLVRTPPQLTDMAQGRFAAMQEAESRDQALKLSAALTRRLRSGGAADAAALLSAASVYQFNYRLFPKSHWARLCDSMFLKRLICNVRERVRILGPTLDDEALTLLLAARLGHASRAWNERRFIAMGGKGASEDSGAVPFTES